MLKQDTLYTISKFANLCKSDIVNTCLMIDLLIHFLLFRFSNMFRKHSSFQSFGMYVIFSLQIKYYTNNIMHEKYRLINIYNDILSVCEFIWNTKYNMFAVKDFEFSF